MKGSHFSLKTGLSLLLSVVLVMAVGVVGLTYEVDEDKFGGEISIAEIGEPATLDGMTTSLSPVSEFQKLIFETPFTYNSEMEPTPLLVKDYEFSEDNTVLDMELRQGVLFHNGKEMTSEDFMASFNRWLEVSVYGQEIDNLLVSAEAIDDYHVRVELDRPYAPFLHYMAHDMYSLNIHPKEVIERAGTDRIPREDYIGTAPYQFDEWVAGEHIRITRFEDYVSPEGPPDKLAGTRVPYLDAIKMVFVPEMGTRLAGIEVGEFHFLTRITPDHWDRIERAPGVTPSTFEQPGYNILFMNLEDGLLADNLKARQAIQAALDMEPILMSAYESPDFYDATGYFYPEGHIFHTKAGTDKYNQGDLEKARQLLEEAGVVGEELRYLTTHEYAPHYDQGMIIRGMLLETGLDVDFMVHDWATVGERRVDPGEWDVFFTRTSIHPEPLTRIFFDPDYPGWWQTETSLAVREELGRTIDPQKRAEVFERLQELVYEEVPYVLLGKHLYATAIRDELRADNPSWRWDTTYWNFFNVWLEDE